MNIRVLLLLSFITPTIASEHYNAQRIIERECNRILRDTFLDEQEDNNDNDNFEEDNFSNQSDENNIPTRSNKHTEIIPEVDGHGCLCM
jgi:hypothetical protein